MKSRRGDSPRSGWRAAVLLSLLGLGLLLSGCGITIRAVNPDATATARVGAEQAVASPSPFSRPTATAAANLAVEGTRTVVSEAPSPTPVIEPEPAATNVPPAPTPTSTLPPPTQAGIPPTPTVTPSRPTPTVMSPSPTPAPSPTPVTAPACTEQPVRGFGLVWSDHLDLARRIGCPASPELGMLARVQTFENGVMIWLDVPPSGVDSAPWVVALADASVSRYRVPDEWVTWESSGIGPSGAFQWVWENAYADRERLGQPTAPWSASEAALQRFDRGTMIWLKNPPGGGTPVIYVVESDLLSSSSGSFRSFADRSFQ